MRYFLLLISILSVNAWPVEIQHSDDDRVVFGVEKLKAALSQKKPSSPKLISIDITQSSRLRPQAFLLAEKNGRVTVSGGDAHGMMYGVLELTERILFQQDLTDLRVEQSPYIEKRGLKFNVPLDARAPSYDDTGDSAQANIEVVWDLSFWTEYLDRMALHRYNQLTLWNPQPFTSMLKLKKYPGLALNDVHVSQQPLTEKLGVWGEAGGVSDFVLDQTKIIKKISIDEKITFWRKVMAHAKKRGIDIHVITWSIYTNGIPAASGIDDRIDNPKTQAFFRQATKELLLTYPDLKGIGVTAGENMPVDGTIKHWTREKWLWETYGRGIQAAKKESPRRDFSFIHRFWYSGFDEIEKYWGDYPDSMAFSFKYLMARIYSSPAPSHLLPKVLPYLKKAPDTKTWWNLRNDDIYVFRWGDPDYARALYRNLPLQYTEGVHMGSDGYVWGRVHVDKSRDMQGKLELDKHWYSFMMWGRLAYNNALDRAFFENQLKLRFGDINAKLLYDTWATASKIIPLVNQFQFQAGDRRFSPETSSSRETFRYVNDFQVSKTLPNSNILNVRDYVSATMEGMDISDKISPIQHAEKLALASNNSLSHLKWLEKKENKNELRHTIDDIKAFSYLGLYYSEKIKTATALELFEKDGLKQEYKKQALEHSEKMQSHWQRYADIGSRNYKSQMLARTNHFDWEKLTKEVAYEVALVNRKVTKPLTVPPTNDPDNKLSLSYTAGLQGETKHSSLVINTPDASEYYLEVYEDTGVHINTYHSHGNGAMRWEWLQDQVGKKVHLNLIWNKLNKVITVIL